SWSRATGSSRPTAASAATPAGSQRSGACSRSSAEPPRGRPAAGGRRGASLWGVYSWGGRSSYPQNGKGGQRHEQVRIPLPRRRRGLPDLTDARPAEGLRRHLQVVRDERVQDHRRRGRAAADADGDDDPQSERKGHGRRRALYRGEGVRRRLLDPRAARQSGGGRARQDLARVRDRDPSDRRAAGGSVMPQYVLMLLEDESWEKQSK